VKQSVYFFRWGITREMSFTSRKTGSFPLAPALPILEVLPEVACPFVPF
jgi:hypothetical protein